MGKLLFPPAPAPGSVPDGLGGGKRITPLSGKRHLEILGATPSPRAPKRKTNETCSTRRLFLQRPHRSCSRRFPSSGLISACGRQSKPPYGAADRNADAARHDLSSGWGDYAIAAVRQGPAPASRR